MRNPTTEALSDIAVAVNTPSEGRNNFSSYVENSDYYRLDLPTQGVLSPPMGSGKCRAQESGTVLWSCVRPPVGVQTWNLPVGANSVAASQTVSIDCRSNTDYY